MKSGERRAAIVESAIHVFAETGFRGTTTRKLAAALGVSEPVLYQHFRTKEDLYAAIIESKACEAETQSQPLTDAARSGDDRAFFTLLGNQIIDYFENDPDMFRLLLYSSLERPELGDMFFDRMATGFFKTITGYIQRRIREGAFRKTDPDIAARALVGMFHHHGTMAMLHPSKLRPHSRKKLVGQMVGLFLDGIAVPNRS